jgi:hypothetical protein
LKDNSYFVSLDQPQSKLIKIIFDKVTTFKDSLFYDVSAWTLPLAFNLNYAYLDDKQVNSINPGGSFNPNEFAIGEFEKSDYAYAFNWSDYYSPRLLWKVLQAGIRVKVTNEPIIYKDQKFERGAIIIPVQNQIYSGDKLYSLLSRLQVGEMSLLVPFETGETEGVYLGSPTIDAIKKPSIALLSETGMSSYEVGEVWHLLDNRFDIQVTLVPTRVFNSADLDKYTTLIMVNGNYSDISTTAIRNLKSWVKEGGNIVAIKGANKWLKKQEIVKTELIKKDEDESNKKDYKDLREYRGAQVTGGVILGGNLDTSHPLGYGYQHKHIPVFVNSNDFFEAPENPYAYPFQFNADPLLSGYISEENLIRVKNSAGIIVSKYGEGRIISFAFNPNFRGFWYGTNKLFLNAIFFGDLIDSRSTN